MKGTARVSNSNIHLRQRDVGILIVSCLAILFSLQQDSGLHLQETWVQPIDRSYYANKHYPSTAGEKLPKPIVTDINGDGFNEIIFVTPDYTIKVVQTISETNTTTAFTQYPIKAESSLLSTIKLTKGRRPIGLASGYLTKYQPNEVRQQHIVVVTDGWAVLCFNHQLKLIWESHIEHVPAPGEYHSELAIAITPATIRVGDTGSVIVGARLTPEEKLSVGSTQQFARRRPEVDDTSDGDNEEESYEEDVHRGEDDMMHEIYHFSYYGFDGRTGASRWKHEEGDFNMQNKHDSEAKEDEEDDEIMPQHSYRLHVLSVTQHSGEVDWRIFKDQLISNHLPHLWRSREDTTFTVDHFQKRTKLGGGDASQSSWSSEDVGLPMKADIPGLVFGGHAPHAPSDHIQKPNVIIAHLSDGLEVIHLFTGRTLCRIKLTRGGLYSDINGDGIIDHAEAYTGYVAHSNREGKTGSSRTSGLYCQAVVTSGVPPMDQLFNGSICSAITGSFSRLFSDNAAETAKYRLQATNPIVIESEKSSTILSSHSQHELDTIFLVSIGRMTSYRPNGKANWQIDTAATWNNPEGKRSKIPPFPILEKYEIIPYSNEVYILAIGQSVVIVSPTGTILSTATPPDSSLLQPCIGDFNNDGINDIIITTSKGYYGYTVTRSSGSVLLMFLSVILLLIMLTLFIKEHRLTKVQDDPPKRKLRSD